MSQDGKLIIRHPNALEGTNTFVQFFLESGEPSTIIPRSDGTEMELQRGQTFSRGPAAQVSDHEVTYSIEASMSGMVLAKCLTGGYEWRSGIEKGEPVAHMCQVREGDYYILLASMVADFIEPPDLSE